MLDTSPDKAIPPPAAAGVRASSSMAAFASGFSLRLILGVGLLVAAFLVVYYATILKLIEYWGANDMYSYGFLVPLISGYIVWLRRDLLRRLPRKPSFRLGTAVLLAGLLMLVVGHVSGTNLIEELSLPITVWGVLLLVFGRTITKSLTFPMAYLLAMIPFWDFLTARLQQPFQLYSAIVGVGGLRLFNIPVLREGVFIYLPEITLEVADVCSGVNNLVAVLCIGIPLTHFYVEGWLRRGVIVMAAVVIALLSNGVRVAMVCLLAFYGIRGPDGDIHGPFSLLRSLVISGVGFLVLFWLISRFANKPPVDEQTENLPVPAQGSPGRIRIAWALAVLLLAGVVGFERWHGVERVPLRTDLILFPRTIGGWQHLGAASFPTSFDKVGFDDKLSRSYAGPDGRPLELLLGYFESQEQSRELVGFELSNLVRGDAAALTAHVSDAVRVKDYVTTVGSDTYHVTYVYVVGGRVTPENYLAKWWTTWDALTKRRSDGALVVVRTKLRQQESIEASRARVKDFVQGVVTAAGAHFAVG